MVALVRALSLILATASCCIARHPIERMIGQGVCVGYVVDGAGTAAVNGCYRCCDERSKCSYCSILPLVCLRGRFFVHA